MARRWYQTIDIDGVDQVFEDFNRIHSTFWNEGKWDNFIAPLLLNERRTFIEIGCNAGLYLKMAIDAGFERVIGVEGNGQIFQQAERFKESTEGSWQLERQHIGADFNMDHLPLADVILISNFHYYLPVHVCAKLIDELRHRCLYCILISARAKRRSGKAFWDSNHVRGYFSDWQEIDTISGIDPEGDPSPRETMYSILFKGNLTATKVDDIYIPWFEAAKSWKHRSYKLAPAMEDFFRRVLKGDVFKYEDTPFYEYWKQREPKRTDEWALNLMRKKKELALDIQKNGMREPIYFGPKGKILDGIHRLSIAKQLGHEYVLARAI